MASEQELIRRARARRSMGRGGADTLRRLLGAGEAQELGPMPGATGGVAAPVPGVEKRQSGPVMGMPDGGGDELDLAASREGNFLRGLLRVRGLSDEQVQAPDFEQKYARTLARLRAGGAAGGYSEDGEFAPQGFDVQQARGLSEQDLAGMLAPFREKRRSLIRGPRSEAYDF